MRLTEAGLSRKWVDDEMNAVHSLSLSYSRPELQPFSIQQLQAWHLHTVGFLLYSKISIYLQGCFYILAIGLLICCLAMAREVRSGKRRGNNEEAGFIRPRIDIELVNVEF